MRSQSKLKNVLVLVTIVVFMPFFWLAAFSGPDASIEENYERRLAELRDRVQFAESLNRERDNDIHHLRHQIGILLGSHQHGNNTFNGDLVIPKETQDLLSNMSFGSSDIQPPGMFHYLPHLIGKRNGLKPAFKLAKGRGGVSIVMGVPTIKRERESYLLQTLQSLLDGLNEQEKHDVLIVVFIGEPYDLEYAQSVGKDIQARFPEALASGILEVISPPAEYYPNMNQLKETFGDPIERVKWRTKQNLDFSFLMLYAKSRGTYYLQLEDDVVTKPGYVATMKNFALNQKTQDWVLLEFSYLGFIGKLFKSSDLPRMVEFFLMFYQDKPIDWLLDHFLYVKVCNPEKDAWNCFEDRDYYVKRFRPALLVRLPGVTPPYPKHLEPLYLQTNLGNDTVDKHCRRSINELRRRYKPSMFQHIGTHSSLKGKVQKLKDKDFGRGALHRPHFNPNAQVSSTLKTYQQHSIYRAYVGETFFWAMTPEEGDEIVFDFEPAVQIDRFYFKSGNADHTGDRFFNTTIEALPVDPPKSGYVVDQEGYIVVAKFDHMTGEASGHNISQLGVLDALRIHVQRTSNSWVILNEINIIEVKKQS